MNAEVRSTTSEGADRAEIRLSERLTTDGHGFVKLTVTLSDETWCAWVRGDEQFGGHDYELGAIEPERPCIDSAEAQDPFFDSARKREVEMALLHQWREVMDLLQRPDVVAFARDAADVMRRDEMC